MVLIVESNSSLCQVWKRHLERLGRTVTLAQTVNEAYALLRRQQFSVIVLDYCMEKGSAIYLSDYAHYCQPQAKVILVTRSGFFSDGSILEHCGNACAILSDTAKPADLAALADHYGQRNVA